MLFNENLKVFGDLYQAVFGKRKTCLIFLGVGDDFYLFLFCLLTIYELFEMSMSKQRICIGIL